MLGSALVPVEVTETVEKAPAEACCEAGDGGTYMPYHARHRRPLSRGRVRAVTLAAALSASTLAAPLTQQPAHAGLLTIEGVPSWLLTPNVVVNPPGPKPGAAIAPIVEHGYAITTDQLATYDITATVEGQQELRAFIAEEQRNGNNVDAATYRVYATPPIRDAQVAGAAKVYVGILDSLESSLDRSLQMIIDTGNYVLDWAEDFRAVADQAIENDRLDKLVVDLQALLDSVPAPGTIEPPDTQPYIDQLIAIVNSLDINSVLYSLGMPSKEEIIEDPLVALPIGGDPVTDVTDGLLGDVVILPVGVGMRTVGASWDEGMLKVTTILRDTPVAPQVAIDMVPRPTNNDPQWDPASDRYCYPRKSNNTAWYNPCRQWYTLAKDGNPDRTSWNHLQFGTAKSKGIWNMTKFEVKAWPVKDSAYQYWLEWSPEADEDHGHCSSGTVGVNVNAAYVEYASQHCDEWDISLGSIGGDFSNSWRGNTNRSERNVAAMKATSVANGKTPNNYVRYDYYAR